MYEPCPYRSSAIRRFERSDAIKICNGIIFDFYTGLSHVYNDIGEDLSFVLVWIMILQMSYEMEQMAEYVKEHTVDVKQNVRVSFLCFA